MASVTLPHKEGVFSSANTNSISHQSKTSLNPISIEDILEFYPEAEQIIEYANSFLRAVHEDKNLPKATLFFKQVVIENASIIGSFSSQKKAQLLFNQYKKMLIPIIESSPKFTILFSQLQDRLPAEKMLLHSLRKIIEGRIDYFHSTIPRIAISNVLKAPIQEISLPGENSDTVLASSLMTQKLFQALVEN